MIDEGIIDFLILKASCFCLLILVAECVWGFYRNQWRRQGDETGGSEQAPKARLRFLYGGGGGSGHAPQRNFYL